MTFRRLLKNEAARLFATLAVRWVLYVSLAALLGFGVFQFLTHDTDTAGAWADAETARQRMVDGARTVGLNMDAVKLKNFYDEPRYLFATEFLVDLRTVLSATAFLALLLGAFAGGSDWQSRVMMMLVSHEPRRLRILAARGGVVAAVGALASLLAGLLLAPFAVLAAGFRGNFDGADGHFAQVLLGEFLRGVLLGALLGLLGYALGMLCRSAVAAFAIVAVYYAGAERLFDDYLPSAAEFEMSKLVFAVLNDKPVIPMELTSCPSGPGCVAQYVGQTPVDGFLGVLIQLSPLLLLASWRFLRKDVG